MEQFYLQVSLPSTPTTMLHTTFYEHRMIMLVIFKFYDKFWKLIFSSDKTLTVIWIANITKLVCVEILHTSYNSLIAIILSSYLQVFKIYTLG